MFNTVSRTFFFLARTPLIPPSSGPAAVELSTLSGPSRPRAASRTFSNLSVKSGYGYSMDVRRGYASDRGKKELYSDEAGSTGAGTDDVAHTDAAFNKNPDPSSSAKQVENEAGKNFTKRNPPNPAVSYPTNQPGHKGGDAPLRTGKEDEKKHTGKA